LLIRNKYYKILKFGRLYSIKREKKRQSVKPENIKHENTYLQFIRKFDIWNKSMSRKLIKNVAIISFLIEIIVEQFI